MPKSSQGHNIEKTSQLFKIVTHTDIKTQEVRKMYVEHEYKIMKLFCDMFLEWWEDQNGQQKWTWSTQKIVNKHWTKAMRDKPLK